MSELESLQSELKMANDVGLLPRLSSISPVGDRSVRVYPTGPVSYAYR